MFEFRIKGMKSLLLKNQVLTILAIEYITVLEQNQGDSFWHYFKK